MRMVIGALAFFTLVVVACGPLTSPPPTQDLESTVEAIVDERMADLLVDSAAPALSSDAAISILRNYLQTCIDSWENDYPRRTGRQRDWWRDLAIGANSDITWSARYLRADIIGVRSRERWVVIGAGLERKIGETGLVQVPGTWQVTAGIMAAQPLDGPAQKAELEFRRPIDAGYSQGGGSCRG